MSEPPPQQPDAPWAHLELPLVDAPIFQELVAEHQVPRELVLRLLLLVTERHYGSAASDVSLREGVEAELKRTEEDQDS